MKTKITISILIGLLNLNSAEAKQDDFCEKFTDLAETIMVARQEGFDIIKLVHMFPDNEDLIVLAYERPRWSALENKLTEVADFKAEIYVSCVKLEKAENKK